MALKQSYILSHDQAMVLNYCEDNMPNGILYFCAPNCEYQNISLTLESNFIDCDIQVPAFDIILLKVDTILKSNLSTFGDEDPNVKNMYFNFFKILEDNSHILILNINDTHPPQNSFEFEFIFELAKNFISLFRVTNNIDISIKRALNAAKTNLLPFINIFKNYDIHYMKSHKQKVGESDKRRRICRFCGKSMSDGAAFLNKAHIIPEALGNKHFICNEECDTCNHYFGEEIESDFIKYFDVSRILANANGKRGSPKLHFKNKKTIYNTKNPFQNSANDKNHQLINIVDKAPNPSLINDIANFSIPLEDKIICQNIYKAVVKMGINFIPYIYLPYFSETIDWLLGEKSTDVLPKVILVACQFSQQAKLNLYIRKIENEHLPFLLVEFIYGAHRMIVIAPFCSKDTKNFLTPDALNEVERVFSRSLTDKYHFESFSSAHPTTYRVTLNFKQRSTQEN